MIQHTHTHTHTHTQDHHEEAEAVRQHRRVDSVFSPLRLCNSIRRYPNREESERNRRERKKEEEKGNEVHLDGVRRRAQRIVQCIRQLSWRQKHSKKQNLSKGCQSTQRKSWSHGTWKSDRQRDALVPVHSTEWRGSLKFRFVFDLSWKDEEREREKRRKMFLSTSSHAHPLTVRTKKYINSDVLRKIDCFESNASNWFKCQIHQNVRTKDRKPVPRRWCQIDTTHTPMGRNCRDRRARGCHTWQKVWGYTHRSHCPKTEMSSAACECRVSVWRELSNRGFPCKSARIPDNSKKPFDNRPSRRVREKNWMNRHVIHEEKYD